MLFSVFICGLSLMIATCNGEDKPDNDILHFTRFVAHDQEKGVIVRRNNIDKFTINVLRKTIFVITDVMGLDDKENYKRLIKNYFETYPINFFLVTRNMNTEVKYKLTKEAFVDLIVDYIMELFKQTKEVYLDLYLIGYKSGVDVAGLVGRKLEEKIGRKIGRITGLSPVYDQYPNDENLVLRKEDAEFVDVVHTNVKNKDSYKSMGHVDFYPNGGYDQPGCQQKEQIPDDVCNDMKSIEYFTDSILSDKLKAVKCESWNDFKNGKCQGNDAIIYGEKVDKKATGNYFFST